MRKWTGWGIVLLACGALAQTPGAAGAAGVVALVQGEGRSSLPVAWLGQVVDEDVSASLVLRDDGRFDLCEARCLTGTWTPRGASTRRFALHLDEPGRTELAAAMTDAIEDEIHFQYAVLAQAAVSLREESPARISLRISKDGSRATLRMRAPHHTYLLGDQVPPRANRPKRARYRLRVEGPLVGAP